MASPGKFDAAAAGFHESVTECGWSLPCTDARLTLGESPLQGAISAGCEPLAPGGLAFSPAWFLIRPTPLTITSTNIPRTIGRIFTGIGTLFILNPCSRRFLAQWPRLTSLI